MVVEIIFLGGISLVKINLDPPRPDARVARVTVVGPDDNAAGQWANLERRFGALAARAGNLSG
jgi:hypothetical protein